MTRGTIMVRLIHGQPDGDTAEAITATDGIATSVGQSDGVVLGAVTIIPGVGTMAGVIPGPTTIIGVTTDGMVTGVTPGVRVEMPGATTGVEPHSHRLRIMHRGIPEVVYTLGVEQTAVLRLPAEKFAQLSNLEDDHTSCVKRIDNPLMLLIHAAA